MSRYISDIIRYFFAHGASPELRQRVNRRLLQTADDKASDDAFREVWSGLDGEAAAPTDTDSAYRRTETALFGGNRQGGHGYRWLRGAALWLGPLLLLGAAAFLYTEAGQKERFYESIEYIHHFTANGEREQVQLPDGSKVWLNGGSLLIYPSHFARGERKVCLSGEAYFDVAKDARRPFTVDVNQLRLRVLGTTFNVSAYPEDHELTATLETGRLQIGVNKTGRQYMLSPNSQLVYNVQTGRVSISEVNTGDYCMWRSGALYLNNIPLTDALRQIERTYKVRIHMLSSNYQDQKIRAHFSPHETIGHVMEILRMLIPELRYEIREGEIYIR